MTPAQEVRAAAARLHATGGRLVAAERRCPMSEIKPGEVVDVAIQGVRFAGEDERGCAIIADENNDQYPLPGQAALERVAPAEWPPQPGDLWRDRDGDTWYGLLVDDDDTDDETYVVLQPGRSSKRPGYLHSDNDGIRRTYGPLTLAYREGGRS